MSLLTSSPEPELEEHYAEDSIDETYEEPHLPTGSGWVKKARTRRGVGNLAASEAQDSEPAKAASSQFKQSAALRSLLRAKKKVLGNIV